VTQREIFQCEVARGPQDLSVPTMMKIKPNTSPSAWGWSRSWLYASWVERLTRELEGYGAYRAKVRYRLVPGIW
jgi:hypothetical protein